MENKTIFSESENETMSTCGEQPGEPTILTVSRYLVPLLVFVGIIGNTLILVVLNSRKEMQTKTNLLLSFMACSDLVHAVGTFFYQLPLYQAYVDFRRIYPSIQMPTLTMMRFSGMSSNWFGVSVTVERLMAIRNPLATVTRNRSTVRLAVLIFISSLAICSQPLVCWSGGSETACHDRVIYFYEEPNSRLWHFYCLIWEQISAYCYIVVPVVLMFACNAALIYFMHRRSKALLRFNSYTAKVKRRNFAYGKPQGTYDSVQDSSGDGRQSSFDNLKKRIISKPKKEMQAAVVVLALSLTSACMSMPSAVGATYYFAAWMLDALPEDETRSWYASFVEISNLLFLAEKNLVVFIYCVTSSVFRRRLWAVIRCTRKKKSLPPTRFMLVPQSTTVSATLRSIV